MRKTERINTEMRYINNRGFFTLHDLMTEFAISRATALRDIQEISALGLPLEPVVGRGGGYAVLNNTVLPAIRFTDNQVRALFVAFMASRNRQLPYLNSRQSLTEKLIGLIPQAQQDALIALNDLLVFEGTNPNKPDLLDLADMAHPLLDQLIGLALTTRCLVGELRNHQTTAFYLRHLFQEADVWYLDCVTLDEHTRVQLAIDDLVTVAAADVDEAWVSKHVNQWVANAERQPNLVVDLGPQAIQQFRKYHPFDMVVTYTDPFQLQGRIQRHLAADTDWQSLANWLLFLGPELRIETIPQPLQELMAN